MIKLGVSLYRLHLLFEFNHNHHTVAVGETLEAELNKAGPGSCKFVTCDISREEDIKVKCSFSVIELVILYIALQSWS